MNDEGSISGEARVKARQERATAKQSGHHQTGQERFANKAAEFFHTELGNQVWREPKPRPILGFIVRFYRGLVSSVVDSTERAGVISVGLTSSK